MPGKVSSLLIFTFGLFPILVICHEPDCDRNVTELIKDKGYLVEDHNVATSDGYILTIQHIIPYYPKEGPPRVVLLQHGLLAASHDWVLNFPHQSLGFILSDFGYDVWLGNVRGNSYAKKHVKLSPVSKAFWKFSFDHMARRDLPAMLDYILGYTGVPSLSYIGHSQGTTIAFALLSQVPEYNQKIKIFIALAPVAFVGNIESPLRYIAPMSREIFLFFSLFGEYDFFPQSKAWDYISQFCPLKKLKLLCDNVYFLMNGADSSHFNMTRAPVYFTHDPAGTSTYNVYHWSQLIQSKVFNMFDWGLKNQRIYNQPSPPQYDLSRVTAPVAVFWGENDVLADPTDVNLLIPQLSNLVLNYKIPDPNWGHLDFVLGMGAKELVYPPVLSVLDAYNPDTKMSTPLDTPLQI